MFEATEAIPFTVAVSEFAKEERTFDVIDVVVAATPFTVEVIMLPDVVARFVVPAWYKPISSVSWQRFTSLLPHERASPNQNPM